MVLMRPEPILTVVLIAGNCRDRIQAVLRSVLEQDGAEQIVVFVYDRAYQPVRDLAEFSHPGVIYEAVDRRSTLGQLQKRAVLDARTHIIAFIEEHVIVPPGWAREALRLHGLGYTGVTGIFVPGNARHHWARIGFLMTYGEYMMSSESGEGTNIPADNASFIRSKLLKFEDELELLFNTDVLLTRRLLAEGEKLYRAGNLALSHSNESTLVGGWTALFYWSQMYVCNRIVVEKWSRIRRLLRLLSSPLVPFVRTFNGLRQAVANSADLRRFFVDTPSLFCLHTGSAAGIAAGLLFGYGDSECKFTDCETSGERQV
jgi:glycosyltransferase involved in cell wall biosynthesis